MVKVFLVHQPGIRVFLPEYPEVSLHNKGAIASSITFGTCVSSLHQYPGLPFATFLGNHHSFCRIVVLSRLSFAQREVALPLPEEAADAGLKGNLLKRCHQHRAGIPPV